MCMIGGRPSCAQHIKVFDCSKISSKVKEFCFVVLRNNVTKWVSRKVERTIKLMCRVTVYDCLRKRYIMNAKGLCGKALQRECRRRLRSEP